MKPLLVPDDEILFGITHELLALWARMDEKKQNLLLKYAWTLIPDKKRGEIRSIAGYDPGQKVTGSHAGKWRKVL